MTDTIRCAREDPRPLLGVVGPCASGKSSVVRALRARGLNAREISQEHSHVPDMWQRLTQPAVLVYLDVSCDVAKRRRPSDADARWWTELSRRLRHAREQADIYLMTNDLSLEQVIEAVLTELAAHSPPAGPY